MNSKMRIEPDPADVAFEQHQAESRANIERLKAKKAELESKIDKITEKIIGKAKASGDWLCYLPRAAGSPELIERAYSYLEKMRTRLEAEGCIRHDSRRAVF